MLIHLKKIRKWHLDYFCVIFFFYDCSKGFFGCSSSLLIHRKKTFAPLCVSDPWKILIMTPSEGQVNDRIALDMEARESHLLMAAKKYWVMLPYINKIKYYIIFLSLLWWMGYYHLLKNTKILVQILDLGKSLWLQLKS